MMKKIVFLIVTLTSVAFSYEISGFTLRYPSQLKGLQLEAEIGHRLYGAVNNNPQETFLGFNTGANVDARLRFSAWPFLDVAAAYIVDKKEASLGVTGSYSITPVFLRTALSIELVGADYLKPDFSIGRDLNAFADGIIASEPILGRISPAINVMYDGISGTFGLGFGLQVIAFDFLDAAVEYYPRLTGKTGSNGEKYDSYSFGFIIKTDRHQFSILMGNNYGMNPRIQMKGAADNNLRFGFTIKRLFSFD
jgi:hypothetical protein